jgi:DNA-directed RNA polymerase subunit RPC12/RpoP
MENSSTSNKPNDSLTEAPEITRCGTCGEEFDAPIFATVSSASTSEEYYACPRCLSRVDGKGQQENTTTQQAEETENTEENKEAPQAPEVEPHADEPKTGSDDTCKHEFGYLKKRPKNEPIPEECLICKKTIECLAH